MLNSRNLSIFADVAFQDSEHSTDSETSDKPLEWKVAEGDLTGCYAVSYETMLRLPDVIHQAEWDGHSCPHLFSLSNRTDS